MGREGLTTLVLGGDAWSEWRQHEVDPGEIGPALASVARTMAANGYSAADVEKWRGLVEGLIAGGPEGYTSLRPAGTLRISYRLNRQRMQVYLDCPDWELAPLLGQPPRQVEEPRSIRLLLVAGDYTIWHEYGWRGGRWRLLNHRFIP